ncbi:MAG: SDR family oxidoreductase [Thermomicrobiales bacterium]
MAESQTGTNGRGSGGAAPAGRIFITGGTGFVGGNLRQALSGRPLRLLVRDPAGQELPGPDVELATGDVTRPDSLRGALDGCDTVIHLVAIIAESGGATFDGVIRQGAANVLAEAKAAGVRHFVLMSAIGARDDPAFPYLKAKWDAEQAVKASGIPWTIFRPSVIFGPGDGFINVLADLVRGYPIIPVVGSGESKFQPVAVGEVAQAYVRAVDDPAVAGQTYELGGPEILTYEGMLDIIAAKLGKRKRKVHLPVGLMRPVVSLSKPLPKRLRPPVTEEQLKMLALDNCTDHSATPELIGRQPTRLQDGIDYILRGR